MSTLEAAEAALGDAIRKDEPNHPTLLRATRNASPGSASSPVSPASEASTTASGSATSTRSDLVAIAEDTAHYVRHDVIPAPGPTVRDTAKDQAATIPGPAVPLDKRTTRRKTA